ncbi:MAG TPA: DUF6574 domain-containing protein [Sporosarcina sp.]|nr:DUF6574 domain-containing protein [Sporosarcina sp.]
MKVCPSCQHEQEAGKFCGNCGTALVEQQAPTTETSQTSVQEATEQQAATTETAVHQAPPEQSSQQQQHQGGAKQSSANPLTDEQIDKLKTNSKHYFKFFTEKLTAPSSTPNFTFGLINIIVFLLVTAIAFFIAVNSQSYLKPSFIGVVFSITVGLALLILVSVLAIFITTLFSSEKRTFKQIVEQFGNYSSITIGLSAIALLLFLFKSFVIGFFVISIALGVTFVVQPTFIVNRYIQTLHFTLDKYFIYLIFVVIQAILYSVLFMVIADSFLGELMNDINNLMFYF